MLTKTLLKLVVVITILSVSCELAAQSDVALETRKAKLQALSEKLKKRDQNDRRQVQEFARRVGMPVRRELPNGRVLELQRLAPGIGPIFYITNNVDAADTVSTDEVWPGGSAGLNLDGSGMTVAEWDSGAIYAAHPDFTGRLTQVDGATEVSSHSTHVAGTLIGAGDWLVAESRGMAYAAHLNAYDWNSDTAEMALAASNGQKVSNHSYGIAAGWLYIGGLAPDNWWWIGGEDPSDVEDANFGYYDSQTQLWDQIAFDAPYYLIVKAAGNDRSDIGPSPGEEYTVIDQDGNFLFTSTLPRLADCAPAGYDCLPTASVAKNILTVGAADDVIGGYSTFSGPTSVQMAEFSGWGPTDDGRIKPDLVGNGMFLMSAWPESPYYAAAAGTSMATPNVTGSLLLLQEHYEDVNGSNNFMRAATLKALAVHTADEAGDADGPDYAFGWGLLNTKNAAQVITDDGGDHQIIEGSLNQGAVDTVEVSVTKADSIITATLVWTDPPGTPVAPALDSPDIMLVNDLDLRIKNGLFTHMPWTLNPAFPAAAATTGDNTRDNVEQVVVNAGATGSYFVEVSHKGLLLDGLNQSYSLIISVEPSPPIGSYLLIDENFSGGLPAAWSVDTLAGISWTINAPIPGDSELDNLTGGTGNFAMVDNNYATTVTSLRTPAFDLSSATAVILRFKSYFLFDFLESINVDISTDGGTGWTNVWQFQGFNPFPTNYVLDLTGAAAGQASFMLRFRFDSMGDKQGNFWQVDDVEVEAFGGGPQPGDPPGPAANPNPADGASGLGLDTNLSWSADSLATSHDVYFCTSSPPAAQGNQPGDSFDPGTLSYDTTYYWRVDEVNDDGTTQGNTWSFTTEAGSPVTDVHLKNLAASSTPGSRNRWTASVQIEVMDAGGSAAANVFAEGSWSSGANGGGSCTTDNNGRCLVSKNNLKSNVSSIVFGVNNLSGSDMSYDSGANEDGNGGVVTVFKDGPVNQLPNAVNNSYTTTVDVPVSGNVLSNDDQGDAPATVTSHDSTSALGVSITIGATGSFSYTPPTGVDGTDTFGYTITDNNGDIDSATVSITIEPDSGGNLLPDAVNDNYNTDHDVPYNGNVMGNDDEGDAPASVTGFDSGSIQGGSISMNGNGAFTYTPPGGYDGPDSFGYTITDDNGDSDSATVSFTVNPVTGSSLSLSVSSSRSRGNWSANLTWSGGTGAGLVTIKRDDAEVSGSPTANDGAFSESLGKKVSGSFVYEVCEIDSGECASDTIQF